MGDEMKNSKAKDLEVRVQHLQEILNKEREEHQKERSELHTEYDDLLTEWSSSKFDARQQRERLAAIRCMVNEDVPQHIVLAVFGAFDTQDKKIAAIRENKSKP